MELDGRQLRQLQRAFLEAFPSQTELEQMLRLRLPEAMREINVSAALELVIFNLINWAEKRDKLDELVSAALEAKPEDQHLRAGIMFLGRQQEIAQIEKALIDPAINVITIYGAGGVGKTTLAHFVVEQQRQEKRFPGGIIWIDCILHDSLTDILAAIAQNLGLEVPSFSPSALRDAVVSHLRSAPTLLVFENYEGVAQNEEVLSFIGRLPKAAKVLIVSRMREKVPGREISIELPSLNEYESTQLLRRYLGPKLWEEIDQNALQSIYTLTGGSPLAIALVAELLKQGQPLSQVLHQLQLSTGDLTGNLIDRINSTLSKQECQFLEILAVFAGPVEIEAIAAVSKMDIQQCKALAQTVSLLAFIRIENGRYYTFHEVVRAYFHSQIPLERLSLLQRRMVRYFLAYARKYEDDFDQLDREWSNIRYSIEVASSNQFWEEFIAFVLVIAQFLEARGYDNEYQTWLKQAVELSSRLEDQRIQAALWHNLGIQYQRRGDFTAALEAYKQSLQKEERVQDRLGEANTLTQLGTLYAEIGELTKAEQFYLRALDITGTLGDQLGKSDLLGNLGNLSLTKGNAQDAIQYFEQALEIKRGYNDRYMEAIILARLGAAYELRYSRAGDLKNLQGAIDLYEQALALSRELGDLRAEASLLANLGTAYSNLPLGERAANLSRAIDFYEQALALSRELGDLRAEASLLANLGTAYSNLPLGERAANLSRAIDAFEHALETFTPETDPVQYARIQNNIANAYANLSTGNRTTNLEQAIAHYQEALQVSTPVASPFDWAATHNNLGMVYSQRLQGDRAQNLEQAIAHYQEALQVLTPEAFPARWAATQNNLGMVYSQRKQGDLAQNLEHAIAHYQEALRIFTQEAFPGDWLRTITNLSAAYAEIGRWLEARELVIRILQALRGAISDSESLKAFTPWYQQLSELALQNQDAEFATRILAEVAHRFELQAMEMPDSIWKRLIELRELLGDDRFIIVCAEAQGALTPVLAQTLQDARQLMNEENFKLAEEKLSSALEILSRAEETKELQRQLATILFMRGFCRRKQAQWQEALEDQKKAFHLFERLRDFIGEARTFLEMGYLLEVMNNYEDARLHYMDAYRLYRRTGSKRGMALASENLGRLEFRVRLFLQAVEDLEEARKLYISLGEREKAVALESDLRDAQASLISHRSSEKK